MSNLYSNVQNYSGRQPDNQQNIKQFVTNINTQANWVYTRTNQNIPPVMVITPANPNANVLVPNNLTVLGSFSNFSDKNFKKNIVGLNEETIKEIDNLLPVEFEFINDNTNNKPKKHYGFIAQDVEVIYPNLVSTEKIQVPSDSNLEEMEIKTINYVEIIPLLLAKIQKQQKQIDELVMKYNEINQ
jgi:hypothetical protein